VPNILNFEEIVYKMSEKPIFNRILLKLSGEGLMGNREYGMDVETMARMAKEIKSVVELGVEVAIVVGGGNIFRGVSGAAKGMDRANADYMGMLATGINALAMQDMLEREGLDTRVLSAIPMRNICEQFVRRRALRHFEKNRVVICSAGTGNPYFTTDTAAALRAAELGCDALLKATQVDGVYSEDPKINPDAKRYEKLTYSEVISRDLHVMDTSAVALCKESETPILVFSLHEDGALKEVVTGKGFYTIVNSEEE
jgi:uridylate kinase